MRDYDLPFLLLLGLCAVGCPSLPGDDDDDDTVVDVDDDDDDDDDDDNDGSLWVSWRGEYQLECTDEGCELGGVVVAETYVSGTLDCLHLLFVEGAWESGIGLVPGCDACSGRLTHTVFGTNTNPQRCLGSYTPSILELNSVETFLSTAGTSGLVPIEAVREIRTSVLQPSATLGAFERSIVGPGDVAGFVRLDDLSMLLSEGEMQDAADGWSYSALLYSRGPEFSTERPVFWQGIGVWPPP